MHFYRSLRPIKAVSFDLDDTLYDNSAVMDRAENAFFHHLQALPSLAQLEKGHLIEAKITVAKNQPNLLNDVVAWRETMLDYLLIQTGLNSSQRASLICEAMEVFIRFRHKIDVPKETHRMLSKLSQKMPVVAISNGNVDIHRIGLGDYFVFSLRAGRDGLSKPYPELFKRAAEKLNLSANEIMHIGDNLFTDILGAVQSGMQSCWFNQTGINLYQCSEARVLPQVEITDFNDIESLVCH